MGCKNTVEGNFDWTDFGYWLDNDNDDAICVDREYENMKRYVEIEYAKKHYAGPINIMDCTVYDIVSCILKESGFVEHIHKNTNWYYHYMQAMKLRLNPSKPNATMKDVNAQRRKAKRRRNSAQQHQKKTDDNETCEGNLDLDDEIAEMQNFDEWRAQQGATQKEDMFSIGQVETYLIATMAMGLIPIANYVNHWKPKNHSSPFQNSFMSLLLTRNEFDMLHQYIHIDPKVFEQLFNDVVKKFWRLFPRIVVDEGMLGFKGRVIFKCFMPGKPEKIGIKYFAMCDEKGYFYSVWIYKGSQSETATDAHGIILNFLDQIPQKQFFVLFADNWYGNLNLAFQLTCKNVPYMLNCRNDRPSQLFKNGMQALLKQKGEHVARYNGLMMAVALNDKRRCNFLTNCFDTKEMPYKKVRQY